MTEIELKAHVYNRQSLTNTLNSFANFIGNVTKDDEYYGKSQTDKNKIRIRKESFVSKTEQKEVFLLTYKKKSLKQNENGICIEVNEEKECSVSNPEAIKSFLLDTGYYVTLQKHKDVSSWQLEIPQGLVLDMPLTATFELCAVPPLGDFLEIEILSPANDSASVAKVHDELETLLQKAGLSKDCIETRYYSEMLHDVLK